MDRSNINPDAKALEDAFFAKENAKLLEKMREKAERTQRRDGLKSVFPHADDALLDRLLELGIQPETALALTLLPLARVAWADGAIDGKERAAILKAATERGLGEGTPGRQLLESWLAAAPGSAVVEAWKRSVRSMWPSLKDDEREELRRTVTGLARAVAEAAGGVLGFGAKVSAAEKAILDEIDQALR